VKLRLAVDQDVVWANSAIPGADDRTEAPGFRRRAADFYVLREIDAPCKGLVGPHHRLSKPSLQKLCSKGISVKHFRAWAEGAVGKGMGCREGILESD
jgi:hypothetical protein